MFDALSKLVGLRPSPAQLPDPPCCSIVLGSQCATHEARRSGSDARAGPRAPHRTTGGMVTAGTVLLRHPCSSAGACVSWPLSLRHA